MKLLIYLILSFTLVSCATSSQRFKVTSPEEVTLDNGLKVKLYKDSSLPYFSLLMMVKAGSTHDPVASSGLAYLTASLLDRGSLGKTSQQMAEELASIGASFGSSVQSDYLVLSGETLSFYDQKFMGLFAKILLKPSFSDEEIDRMKSRLIGSIKQMVDKPSAITSTIFNQYIYGDHPYAKNSFGKVRDLKSIKKKDILKFYLKYFRPNNSTLAVVGNFDKNIVKDLNRHFGAWKPRKLTPLVYPPLAKIEGRQILLIDNPNLNQAQIIMGHKGYKRSDKNHIPLKVLNGILGGTYSSRLVQEVRSKRGLTYNVSSSFAVEKEAGTFSVGTFTRLDKVGETIQAILGEIDKIKKEGVTEEEVQAMTSYMKGQFPRMLQTFEATAQVRMLLDFYEVPEGYLNSYIDELDGVDKDQLNELAKQYLDSQNIKILVYGPKSQLIEQLRKIGVVKVKSYQEYL